MVQANNIRVADHCEHISLSLCVLDLSPSHEVLLAQDLHREKLLRFLLRHQNNLAKGTLADHGDHFEVALSGRGL